jgi:hypothetical protein
MDAATTSRPRVGIVGAQKVNDMKPSDFMRHPYDSIYQHMETEIVARNIMVILSRTGNTWRKLTWDEYQSEGINILDTEGV